MNSLNIISSRVSPPPSPGPTRSNSLSTISLALSPDDASKPRDNQTENALADLGEKQSLTAEPEEFPVENPGSLEERENQYAINETTPLITKPETKVLSPRGSPWVLYPKRIANAFVNSLRWILHTLTAPGVYLIACLYSESGDFAPLQQLRKLFGIYGGDAKALAMDYHENIEKGNSSRTSRGGSRSGRIPRSSSSSSSGLSSESESDPDRKRQGGSRRDSVSGKHHLRSQSLQDTEEIAPARRSIRIKLHADESLRQRKHRKGQSASSVPRAGSTPGGGDGSGDISAHLKSPTSPVAALTKYPKTPGPPRPLIPRRQPSYINTGDVIPGGSEHQKTLILDLDETLIHSMSKGGRMSSGHMVEVRLNTTYVGVGGQNSIGPQHPILYYVHKRPHCDEFLRRVSKWYNLVVFTASVQEYADPVIDWLEADRKYFSARYYRQHCTFRHGAFIKDLSSVEPDLSRVIILDNSPLSYMFHQDNAIPIQGWISDPTDADLMYLIPFLEGMQYVSDVRALLALRGGEDGQHMA
ncbi:NLI interacting factor-like phosphatase-domain-containing protein [Apiosordaria backusii]|uniref:NLI interacting factor-like phosphatase-domain-containing protein n=1 Tax=Apiosordaria backusii TaxID=314023 RepID=A0AA40A3V1_9PEZI|nr:NLI interacting factor-like phosphatase-domain-containing protein [Apiosordaria backusii]